MTGLTPLVSVITPTYNRAEFLAQTAKSVLGQTYPHFEWIIVDDGSKDNTVAVLEPFLSDSRVKYVYQENAGQNVARNRALKEAKGEFICFLDSDDLWFPEKLSTQLAAFRGEPSAAIVHGDEVLIDGKGRELSRDNMPRYSGTITAQLLADNSVSITTAMVRRRCFEEMGGMSEAYPVADDYELWLRFSTHYRFLYVPKFLASYRVMQDQISSDKRRRLEINERILTDFLRAYPNVVSRRQQRDGLARFYARKARYFASVGDSGVAFSAWRLCFENSPLSRLTWRTLIRCIFPQRSDANAARSAL